MELFGANKNKIMQTIIKFIYAVKKLSKEFIGSRGDWSEDMFIDSIFLH